MAVIKLLGPKIRRDRLKGVKGTRQDGALDISAQLTVFKKGERSWWMASTLDFKNAANWSGEKLGGGPSLRPIPDRSCTIRNNSACWLDASLIWLAKYAQAAAFTLAR